MRRRPGWALTATLTALTATAISPTARAADPPAIERFLTAGKLEEGEKALTARLEAVANDDQARFSLGVLQFLRAVEARVQGLYRHGFRPELGPLSGMMSNLPVGQNPKPEPIDAAGLRAMLQAWLDDLARVEATLAKVSDPDVKLPLHFGRIRLDANGDGDRDDDETLWKVFARFNGPAGRAVSPEEARAFVVAFDRGDVDWLRGYCHLLSAMADVVLAHDFDDLFRDTGYLFFRGARPPHDWLVSARRGDNDLDTGLILDLVAMVHRLHLKVREPQRLRDALDHLKATVSLSRSSWKAILAEADDDHEWVPNPKQTSVIPAQVTPEMIEGWNRFLDEFEAILAGKKLVPFWRGNDLRLGVNVHKVLTEPKEFDLVLWVQGTGALPFLEKGDVTSPEFWGRLNRLFRGEFLGFAIWFN